MRRFTVLFVVALVVGGLFACSTSTPGGQEQSCPQDLPSACPNDPPSFKSEVHAIIDARCGGCHTDGGVAASARDFSSYALIAGQRSPILNQFYACKMPPADAGKPTPEERQALLTWLVCRAPDN